jgi:hypothetical protein
VHDRPHDLPRGDRDAADRADRRADDADSAARRADIEAAAADALRDPALLTTEELAAHARAASERSAAAKQRWLDRAGRGTAATKRAQEDELTSTDVDALGPVAATAARRGRVCPTCGRVVDDRFGVLFEGRWYHGAHLPAVGA